MSEIPTDTELLNFLQRFIDQKNYTGNVIARVRSAGGLAIQETRMPGAVPSIRDAIANLMLRMKAEGRDV